MGCIRLIMFGLIVLFGFQGLADAGQWNGVGVRGGVGDARNRESFSQYEVYITFSLPWMWESDSKWIIGSFMGINAGTVLGEDSALVGSIGPGVYFMTPTRRFVFWTGIYPTYISRSKFEKEDFGGLFQFTSAACANINFLENWTAGYCFQHMSNASFYDKNPGLNTHMLGLGVRF
jgi:hypothetical protein